MEYVIDSEMMIRAVKKRPIIWNYSHEHHKDRNKKRSAWIEICGLFFEDFDAKDDTEKAFIARQVELKWRHIRDNYTRCLRGKSRGQRMYIYADQLEFMRRSIEHKFQKECDGEGGGEASESREGEEAQGNDYYAEELEEDSDDAVEIKMPKKRHRSAAKSTPTVSSSNKILPFEMVPVERLETQKEASEESDDMSFFRSLVPMLSTLTPPQKMKFRIDVMQHLVKYHESTSCNDKFGLSN